METPHTNLVLYEKDFEKIEEEIKRLHQQTMGFEGDIVSPQKVAKFLSKAKAEDLVTFGFESEFIGRLPISAVLDALTVNDLEQILLNPNCSIINAKKQDFMGHAFTWRRDLRRNCTSRTILRTYWGPLATALLCQKPRPSASCIPKARPFSANGK